MSSFFQSAVNLILSALISGYLKRKKKKKKTISHLCCCGCHYFWKFILNICMFMSFPCKLLQSLFFHLLSRPLIWAHQQVVLKVTLGFFFFFYMLVCLFLTSLSVFFLTEIICSCVIMDFTLASSNPFDWNEFYFRGFLRSFCLFSELLKSYSLKSRIGVWLPN